MLIKMQRIPTQLLARSTIVENRIIRNFLSSLSSKNYENKEIYTLDPIDSSETTFKKILIANRGEIACRIIKTAKKMGIKTVAVFSAADAQSRHVKLADESVFIGPPAPTESYLNTGKILDAIKSTDSEAVHPGYGFLSENASFAAKLEDEGVAFIGPSARAITGMGDKLESKRLAKEAGVNVIPGFDGIIRDAEHCVKISRQIGYPVMIKASAGGGGKGMRIANNDTEARDGFKMSTEEAASSFGDSRMLVEKFIKNPRHIEIQVLADKHGNAVYLNERECSIQRRNQKVIEEAPSTFLDEKVRQAMGNQAIMLCQKLAYSSAGTVEFLVDETSNFYFLEMNTRLQVEHPITECITGVDLVQQMIRIAKGHKLNISQEDVKIRGWAIESRVYAEDPYKNFGLPSVGRLYKYMEPLELAGVRCDSGIEEGSEISFYYDPMISKLVCYGGSREEAIQRSIAALDNYVIRGVTHNIPLLRDILGEQNFLKGNISTNYLQEVYADGFHGHKLENAEKERLLTVAAAIYASNELRNRNFLNGPRLQIHDTNWQKWEIVIDLNDKNTEIHISQVNGYFEISFDGKTFKIEKKDINLASPFVKLELDGEPLVMQLVRRDAGGNYKITYQGTTYSMYVTSKQAADLLHLMPAKPVVDVSKIIKAPMPGIVKSVSCNVGDEVVEGQELCVIEAMKMQNAMSALATGVVKAVLVKAGDTVSDEDLLIELQ